MEMTEATIIADNYDSITGGKNLNIYYGHLVGNPSAPAGSCIHYIYLSWFSYMIRYKNLIQN